MKFFIKIAIIIVFTHCTTVLSCSAVPKNSVTLRGACPDSDVRWWFNIDDGRGKGLWDSIIGMDCDSVYFGVDLEGDRNDINLVSNKSVAKVLSDSFSSTGEWIIGIYNVDNNDSLLVAKITKTIDGDARIDFYPSNVDPGKEKVEPYVFIENNNIYVIDYDGLNPIKSETYNVNGILKDKAVYSGTNHKIIDVSGYSHGIYFVLVFYDNRITYFKFIR